MTLAEVSIVEVWQALGGVKLSYPSYDRRKPRRWGLGFTATKGPQYELGAN
jgi:hypothetical protein